MENNGKSSCLYKVLTLALTILTLVLGYYAYDKQKEANDYQKSSFIETEVERQIEQALDLISEGESLKSDLVQKKIDGVEILMIDKKRSFNLVKQGLEILEKLKNDNKSIAATKHLIRFYKEKKQYNKKVIKLQNELIEMSN